MALSEMSILKNIKNGNLEGSGYIKPRMSYAQLIAEALNNAPEKALVLSDIYKAINAKYPYYELETHGWQNGIRHTLSLNKNFIKGHKLSFGKRGWYWTLQEDRFIPAIGVKKRDHICSDCNIGFASSTTLKNHTIATGHEGKLQKSEDLDGVSSDKSFIEDHSIPARRIGTVDTSIYIEIPSKMPSPDILTEDKPIPNYKKNQQKLPPQIISPPSASEQTIQTRKVINITTEVWQLIGFLIIIFQDLI